MLDIEQYAQFLPQYYSTSIPHTLVKLLDSRRFTSLLDAGCGDGSLLFALKHHGYFRRKKIYAVDLSQSRIDLVKKIDPSIYALVDDVEILKNIPKRSIDMYISTFVIEHVDDALMIRAIARVLKKGGIAYLSTVFKKWYGWYYYRKNGQWVMDVTHLREYTQDNQLLQHINEKEFSVMINRKNQLYFPIADFIVRRLPVRNRQVFIQNRFFNLLRSIKIPIPGYYEWEIVLEKK